ncbi:MAG: methyltransferase domain-containing protein [Ilumatobacter sp.]|uniref:methyltransferase domain-containing protein n=1 Tax=Ilumatobacter sp. TaxID=1967498 RepID=UPI00391952EB
MTTDEQFDCVIVGVAAHPIVVLLASEMSARGWKVAVLDGVATEDLEIAHGVSLLSADTRLASADQKRAQRCGQVGGWLEHRLLRFDQRAIARFAAEFGGDPELLSIRRPIERGERIASVIRQLEPRVVFVNHAFHYGWVPRRVSGIPVVVMPWGDDLFDYAPASRAASRLVRSALRSSELCIPSAVSSLPTICDRFSVPRDRARSISWGVDLSGIPRRSTEVVFEARERLGLPQDSTIVFNTRRLRDAWGGDTALAAQIAIARRFPATYHVVIAGVGNWEDARAALRATAQAGVSEQFRIVSGNVDMNDFEAYCSASDIGLSLKRTRDMRSLSMLQAAAAGMDVVCTDQPEYRAMESEGFRASFVQAGDADGVVEIVSRLLEGQQSTEPDRAANRQWIEFAEDRSKQMPLLLELIASVAESKGRTRVRCSWSSPDRHESSAGASVPTVRIFSSSLAHAARVARTDPRRAVRALRRRVAAIISPDAPALAPSLPSAASPVSSPIVDSVALSASAGRSSPDEAAKSEALATVERVLESALRGRGAWNESRIPVVRATFARMLANVKLKTVDNSDRPILEIGADGQLAGAKVLHELTGLPVVATNLVVDGLEGNVGQYPITVRQTGIDALEFPDASFSMLFGRAVLEHISGLDHFLAECHRVLEDGGVLYLDGGPLYLSPKGHHMAVKGADGTHYGFDVMPDLLPDWCQLTHDRESLEDYLRESTEVGDDAAIIAEYVFTSPEQNRLAASEIILAFARSPFEHVSHEKLCVPTLPPLDLVERYGETDLVCNGLVFFATK